MAAPHTRFSDPIEVPREIRLELETFEAEVERFRRGELTPERFRAFRLSHGVYGQRQAGVQMIRVKIPAGRLTSRQLRGLADIAEEFTPTGLAHLTTRQDVQYHFVRLEEVPRLLLRVAEAGLTTREACGNSVRNVTACPLTGAIAEELFDVGPYAQAVYAYLVRNPFCQQLARKFKIALSSCPEDCAAAAIHDIGLLGCVEEAGGRTRYGFRVLVGGGLGSTPMLAQVLHEFVPLEKLLVSVRGILKVYSEHGNRRSRMKARLKFVVRRQGIEEFRRRVAEAVAAMTAQERQEAELLAHVQDSQVPLVRTHLAGEGRISAPASGGAATVPPTSHPAGAVSAGPERRPPELAASGMHAPYGIQEGLDGAAMGSAKADPFLRTSCPGGGGAQEGAFRQWASRSTRAHKDPARIAVTVMLPLGDIEGERLRRFADLVESHGGDRAVVAIDQNFVLPEVRRSELSELYRGLAELGLAEGSAGTALDVTSCPGADTCGLGITSSKGLARAIRSELISGLGERGVEPLSGIRIKISGCPNSCGQHHIGTIGLHGVAKKIGERQMPAYQIHLGGEAGRDAARIGDAMDKIPAKRVPAAVAALLRQYAEARTPDETFEAFVRRVPRKELSELLKPFADTGSDTDGLETDWGQDGPFTTDDLGVGECAGAGLDMLLDPFGNYEAELRQASLFMEREQWTDALANLGRARFTFARVLLERIGRQPESDYETACELRAHVIDRGHLSEAWNETGSEAEILFRARRPDPAAVKALHARLSAMVADGRGAVAALDRLSPPSAADAAG